MPLSFLLSSSPRMWTVGDRFYARTPLPLRILSLLSYDRELLIDRNAREVRIRSRCLWAIQRERTIPFDRVSHLDLDYAGIALGGDHNPHALDCLERYTVSLELASPRESVRLFCFTGDLLTGDTSTALSVPGIALGVGDDAHAGAARAFVARLAEWLGVSLGRPAKYFATADGIRYYCSDCGRGAGPGGQKCIYCGGALDAVVEESQAQDA